MQAPIREAPKHVPVHAAALLGTVVVEDQPLAGARVCAHLSGVEVDTVAAHVARCVSSQADGTFELGELPAGEFSIFANKQGHRPGMFPQSSAARVTLDEDERKRGLVVAMQRGGAELRGTITNATGERIANAQVLLRQRGTFVAQARTDADGSISLWGFEGAGEVIAVAEGHAWGREVFTLPDAAVSLRLMPASALEGVVVDAASGAAVANAWVTARDARDAPAAHPGQGGRTQTDARGQFRFAQLQAGRYRLSARAGEPGDDGLGFAASVGIPMGQTIDDVRIEVMRGGRLSGTIRVAETKSPCPNGEVVLQDDATGVAWNNPIVDGVVAFGLPFAATVRVHVACKGYLGEPEYPSLTIQRGQQLGVEWLVHQADAIGGVVVDAASRPVAGARVELAADERPAGVAASALLGESDEHGVFRFDGLPPGVEFRLSAGHPDHAKSLEPIRVTAPANGVRVKLDVGRTIEGIVQTRDGEAVGGVWVALAGVDHRTRADGSFVLRHLPAGPVMLTVSDADGVPLAIDSRIRTDPHHLPVDVAHQEGRRLVVFVDQHGASLRGQVVDEANQPIAGAFVVAMRESTAPPTTGSRTKAYGPLDLDRALVTDTQGRFRFEPLAAGMYTLRALVKGGGEALARHVKPGGDVSRLRVAATATIAGTVVGLDGGPAPELFAIRISDAASEFFRDELFLTPEPRWKLEGLPAGRHRVELRSAAGPAHAEVELTSGEARDGVVLQIERETVIQGRVMSLEDRKPLAGYAATARAVTGVSSSHQRDQGDQGDQGDHGDHGNVSGVDGRFEIRGAPVGRVTLHLVPRAGSRTAATHAEARITVDVASGATLVVGDIYIPKWRLPPGNPAGDFGFSTSPWDDAGDQELQHIQVTSITEEGAAALAGMQVGDVITTMDEHDVRGNARYIFEFRRRVPPGTAATFRLQDRAAVRLVAQ